MLCLYSFRNSRGRRRQRREAKKVFLHNPCILSISWTSPCHIIQHLISILIKSCSARGRSDLHKIKPQKQISRRIAVRTLMYFKLDESLAHSSLNFRLELAMQLRRYI